MITANVDGDVMAARRTRRKTARRRSTKTINAASVLEAGMIANAVTMGMFNTNLKQFFFNEDGGSGTRADNLSQITFRELIAGATGTGDGYGTTTQMATTRPGSATTYSTVGSAFGETVKANLKENGFTMVSSLVLIPVGFKVFSKLTAKPRAIANKGAKMAGLPVRV
tara:strand:+ start:522 stop:1025 length:504 start_codon:yes stop_codon:yes gene_type:complete